VKNGGLIECLVGHKDEGNLGKKQDKESRTERRDALNRENGGSKKGKRVRFPVCFKRGEDRGGGLFWLWCVLGWGNVQMAVTATPETKRTANENLPDV